jgi:hypothetical protein
MQVTFLISKLGAKKKFKSQTISKGGSPNW